MYTDIDSKREQNKKYKIWRETIVGLSTLRYSLVRVYVNLVETFRETKLYLYKHRVILKWKWGKNHREGLTLIPGKTRTWFTEKQEKRRRIEECRWKGKRERRNPVVGNPDLVVYSLESKTILTATRIHSFLSKSTLIIQDIVSKVSWFHCVSLRKPRFAVSFTWQWTHEVI